MSAITSPETVTPTAADGVLPADGVVPADDVVPADGASRTASRTTTVVAISLWVLVSGLLGYGIAQTVMKAAALFG